MQRSALCRSRRELSNEYFLAKFGFDTAENEPIKVCPLSVYSPDHYYYYYYYYYYYRSPRYYEEQHGFAGMAGARVGLVG